MSLLNDVYKTTRDPNYRITRLERGVQTQRAGTLVTPSGSYGKIPTDLLNSAGQIPIFSSALVKRGAVPTTGANPGFAYTSTDTTIHLYWDGTNGSNQIVLYRTDGSREAIPTGDVEITGLSASTTYYFLPYWNPSSNSCSIGFVTGTVGNPPILFTTNTDQIALQAQNMQELEQLSNGYAIVATAAGGGSGGGGGIGCVMQGTEIEALGGHPYTMDIMPESLWLRFATASGKSLTCSTTHVLYLEGGKVQASEVKPGDRAITVDGVEEIVHVDQFRRACTKWRVRMAKGHLYWANGFLSHNVKQFE